jgi:putative intracellular protease/amidase
MASSDSLPSHYGVLLFPGFQALDAFGPLDILNLLSKQHTLNLSIIAETLDPVSTSTNFQSLAGNNSSFGESVVPTHTFDNPPENLEVLLVPGGFGLRDESKIPAMTNFLEKIYPQLKFLLTVCTGSVLAARAGLLDGKRATTNKFSWEWVCLR